MHCKSLWIKASAKCINVNVNHIELFFHSLLLSLSGQYTNLRKNGRPGEYPCFFSSNVNSWERKLMCIITRLLDPCIMSCESRVIHMSLFLCTQVCISNVELKHRCKRGHYRGFFIYAHYRSAQSSFIGAWGGGSNKMMYRIRFQGCWIRLVQAQIKPCSGTN